jgi:UDP-N-acetylglucosamine 4-epimerase
MLCRRAIPIRDDSTSSQIVTALVTNFARLRPSSCENVLPSHYLRVREQLVARPRRWLVTGAAGFIGSNIVSSLLDLGQHVVGLDDFSAGYRSNIAEVVNAHPGREHLFVLIEGDIRDRDCCREACADVDYVLHLAALASVPRSIDDPATAHSVNVDGFFNMLLAARGAGVKRFVYASSSAVYGDAPGQPQREEKIGRALSPYAAQKYINECYASTFQLTYGLETVGLRYYNIFGPRQDPDGAYAAVLPRWTAKLIEDERCEIYGDGETTRDFCYVANVVQANVLAAMVDDPAATGQVYNVASAQSVTLNELYTLIADGLATLTRRGDAPKPSYLPFRAGDVRHSSGSIEKAQRVLGYSPSHDVRAGLEEALPWYLSQRCAPEPARV